MDLVNYCRSHNIIVNSWCPYARPDSWVQQPPCAANPILDPTAAAVASKHGATSAQVQMAWQVMNGVLPNPRSQNVLHMQQNMDYASIELDASDVEALNNVPQSLCEPPACTNPVVPGQYPSTCVNNGK